MGEEIKKLALNDMTQLKMNKLFGLEKRLQLGELDAWLSELPELSAFEYALAKHFQQRLIENINVWNEQELSLHFIGPVFAAVNFTVLNRLNLFAQRPISAIIGDYELSGKPDGLIASGYWAPEQPYFCFQEYKKEPEPSGDPIGQTLAALLVGQKLNENSLPIYGCYVVGRSWYFIVLENTQYAISKDFSAADEDIFHILRILKALRTIIFKRAGLTLKE